jgi:hypothetical protein
MSQLTDDIHIIKDTLKAAKTLAFSQRYGGTHSLWKRIEGALEAVDRLQAEIEPHQPDLLPPTGPDLARTYTHKRPEPDTAAPTKRP